VILRPIGAAAALLIVSAAPPTADPVRPVVEAERAFAAEAQRDGNLPAFRHYADDEAILFAPDPRRAKDWFDAGHGPQGSLRWWPVYAGIAASGDLGFSTGPYFGGEGEHLYHGWFLTIWARKSDGSWRWLLDHGTPTLEPPPSAEDAPVVALPVAPRVGSKGKARESLLAVEAALAAALREDAPKAYAAALADDGRLMRMGAQPAVGRAAFVAAAAAGPPTLTVERTGGAVSRGGDLAYTYGNASWAKDGVEARGHYVRVWQRRRAGWKLIVDETTPVPPAPRKPG
jgi:ketosteroid isomerase-like protein